MRFLLGKRIDNRNKNHIWTVYEVGKEITITLDKDGVIVKSNGLRYVSDHITSGDTDDTICISGPNGNKVNESATLSIQSLYAYEADTYREAMNRANGAIEAKESINDIIAAML